MRIAVDVMGGDHGCGVVIAGDKLALQANKKISQLFLVGNEAEISAALEKQGVRDERVTIINASQVLTMEDKPVVGLRKKKDCSILRAVESVSGRACRRQRNTPMLGMLYRPRLAEISRTSAQ